MASACSKSTGIRSGMALFLRRASAALSFVLLAATATPALSEGLAGKILIASPTMPENAFSQTVILICKQDKNGVFGLVVNRPAGIPDIPSKGGRKFPVRLGGPVEPRKLLLLMTDDLPPERGLAVPGGYAVTDAMPYLNDAARPSRRFVVIAGHSSWDPGQLEAEMGTGAWLVGNADEEILFGNDDEAKWRRMIERRK